ncbi:MAG: hypothetical protein HY720_27440 [Planctomycetes bacterium]|nr:hypothetical protein [Planctomycetota bacterium]
MIRGPAVLLTACALSVLSVSAPAQESSAGDIQLALESFDADGDGRVSREEFRGEPVDFLRLDVDEDGFVTERDLVLARGRSGVPGDPENPAGGAPDAENAGSANRVSVTKVFDRDRDLEHDILVLLGGDELRGVVQTESFELVTVYGRVAVPASRIAGIDLLAAPDRVDRMVCVNGDAFSGVCANPTLRFLQAGAAQPIEIRREKVLRILRRFAEEEAAGIERRWYFVLANGDHFGGWIESQGLVLSTLYGDFPLDLERIDRIELAGGGRNLSTVRASNGDTMSGVLGPEDLSVGLDILAGVEGARPIEIATSRIDTLYVKDQTIREAAGSGAAGGALSFDFETGPEGWTVEGAETTWHHTRAEAASGSASFECAAAGALAYTNSARAALTSPPLDLSRLSNPVLSFARKVQTEEGYDLLIAEVSYDGGGSWQQLISFSGTLPWEKVEFPLAGGAANARVRFRFQSDDSEPQRGVWVDAVEVKERR